MKREKGEVCERQGESCGGILGGGKRGVRGRESKENEFKLNIVCSNYSLYFISPVTCVFASTLPVEPNSLLQVTPRPQWPTHPPFIIVRIYRKA